VPSVRADCVSVFLSSSYFPSLTTFLPPRIPLALSSPDVRHILACPDVLPSRPTIFTSYSTWFGSPEFSSSFLDPSSSICGLRRTLRLRCGRSTGRGSTEVFPLDISKIPVIIRTTLCPGGMFFPAFPCPPGSLEEEA